ncbi:hypothetical protein D3C71_1717030 [compost metagenome]
MRQIAHLRTAPGLGHGDAQHAQRAHLLPQVHGELVAAVDLRGPRCNLGLRKLTHRVTQRIDVFAQLEVESWKVGHGLSPVEYFD